MTLTSEGYVYSTMCHCSQALSVMEELVFEKHTAIDSLKQGFYPRGDSRDETVFPVNVWTGVEAAAGV